MAKKDSPNAAATDAAVAERDILFECPSCSKSLVVDESAEGMIIECPQCNTSVIVPPRASVAEEEPGPPKRETQAIPAPGKPAVTAGTVRKQAAEPKPTPRPAAAPAVPAAPIIAELHDHLTDLSSKLREVQTQWADTTNRIATRINDVNRELVTLARLETSHKELLHEWNGLISRLAEASDEITKPLPEPPKKG